MSLFIHMFVMSQMRGVTRLDFIPAHSFRDNSLESFARCQRLMADVARDVFVSRMLTTVDSLYLCGKRCSWLIGPIMQGLDRSSKETCGCCLEPFRSDCTLLSRNALTQ
ncbi:hypothetical protein TOPH_06178 [Tolypocladium ophioglossoides CBS 100239]|uniref:Uncharacterized protein n=1 Tax=Tolypocladium ophioglossoides (strain CBS 100239) TaxID=1163406 RepID=A0A0L0N5F7_TOLOC|nr:hypothetical protein TOPH_06178 [Tolypocladium ophioglossoides CBS 100239]